MMMWIGIIYIFFYDKIKLRRCTPIDNFGVALSSLIFYVLIFMACHNFFAITICLNIFFISIFFKKGQTASLPEIKTFSDKPDGYKKPHEIRLTPVLFNRIAPVAVSCQYTDYPFILLSVPDTGNWSDLLVPDLFQCFIRCPDFMSSHKPAAFVPFMVKDQHPVTAEFFADPGAGGVNDTGEPIS